MKQKLIILSTPPAQNLLLRTVLNLHCDELNVLEGGLIFHGYGLFVHLVESHLLEGVAAFVEMTLVD